MSVNSQPFRRSAAAVAAPRWLALLAAVTAVLLSSLTAASSARAEDSAGQSRTQQIVAALRENPVYVDPAYRTAVPPARQKALTARIERTGLPIRVALVPLAEGDVYDGDPQVLAQRLYERLGQRELILITPSDITGFLNGHEWPSDQHQAEAAVHAVGFLPETEKAGLAAQVAKAVDLIEEGRGKEVYREATAHLDGTARRYLHGGSSDFPWALTVGGVGVLTGVGAGLYLRHRRAGRAGGLGGEPFARPQAVMAAAREVDLTRLRRQAEEEVLALGEAVRAAEVDVGAAAASGETRGAPPGGEHAADAEQVRAAVQRALDAYAAAGTVLDSAAGQADLAGVLALVAEGRDALRVARSAGHAPTPSGAARGLGRRVPRRRRAATGPAAPPLPLCFFNPLHGRAARRITWRPLGGRRPLDVAACADCVQAVAARRAPEVLTDELDGRTVPYFEVPAEASVWAATGYGSLDDGLARRVNRGDHTRARAARG